MPPPTPSRRAFLTTLGLTAGAATSAGCGAVGASRAGHILPLLDPEPRAVEGRPAYFATVCRECPAGCGMVVRVNDGRPTKAEGNPDHPVNRGKLCMRGQAALQGLYNPDRFQGPRLRDGSGNLRPVSWEVALTHWHQALAEARGGNALWLGGLETGALDATIQNWLRAHGWAPPLYYEPFAYSALRQAYGGVVPRFHFDRARYILSFGAEFLETWVSNVEFARDFTIMHSLGKTAAPGRFVAIGPRLNLTAANADEFWACRPGTEAVLAAALLAVVEGGALPGGLEATTGVAPDVVARAGARLRTTRPSLVLGTGYGNDHRGAAACHAICARLNQVLGNEGITVDPATPHALSRVATAAAVGAALAARPHLLLLHHANPVYHHPGWAAAVAAIPYKVSFARCPDETTALADLVLPDHDALESWGDYAPWQGAPAGVLQPTRLPLYDTRPTVAVLGGALASYDPATLMRGVAAAAAAAVAAGGGGRASAPEPDPPVPAVFDGDGDFYLCVFPSVQWFDGRSANRSWCQEIAEPLSKIAWDGWAEMHPDAARAQGLQPNDVIRLHSPHGSAEFPLFVTTWIRPDTVGVVLGQGHWNYGRWANGRGENVHRLQDPAAAAAQTVKVRVEKTAKQRPLANLQAERLQRDKKMALAVSLTVANTPAAAEAAVASSRGVTLYADHPRGAHRWGMAIDLDSCIGCNACQAACYAENNIAVWGRSSALSHREMTWIRVEVWEGDGERPSSAMNPDLRFLPMPCQQCSNAPCEYVCPVFAAYHTDEGLNAQVYNRCVGTRYCSNNCIYKVRRFNWYTPQWDEPLTQQLNPDVTVRAKGVMEKCTFCVQRIEAAELDARSAGRAVRDGEIVTACMQTCPTDAIVFGDRQDESSQVSSLARLPRAYGLLAEENTYPAVSYLKRVQCDQNARVGDAAAD